jgi:predicted esterase
MLWEIMFEMLGELFSSLGEIFVAFWKVLKSIFGVKKNATPEEKKKRAQRLLNCGIVALCLGIALMFPGVRKFVFQGGAQRMVAAHGPPVHETPRNEFPMGQYTLPQLYKKKKVMIEDDDGLRRIVYYYWHAPAVAPGQKLPLVVILHGGDGLSHAAIYLRSAAMQSLFPAFLLIPMSPFGKIWDAPAGYTGNEGLPPDKNAVPGEESRSLKDAIYIAAQATIDSPVDVNRMYIIGCDEGAAGVYGAAAHYPGIFAGGVAVAGRWSFIDVKALAKTPLLLLHGAKDQAVPASFPNTLTRLVTASGGKMTYHEFPNVDHTCESPGFYSQAVWNWLFSQSRATAPEAASPPAPAAVMP